MTVLTQAQLDQLAKYPSSTNHAMWQDTPQGFAKRTAAYNQKMASSVKRQVHSWANKLAAQGDGVVRYRSPDGTVEEISYAAWMKGKRTLMEWLWLWWQYTQRLEEE